MSRASMLPRRAALGLLAAGAFVLAGCEGGPTGGGGPRINASAPVPVALLVPAGSGQASDVLLAQSLENGARLAIADLGGVQVDLRVYPTYGQPDQAAAAAEQAITEGAKVILGPVFASEASAVGQVAAGRGISVLSFSNNAAIAGGNVFVLGPTFQNTANRLVSYAASQGRTRIAIVADRNAAGAAGRQAIERAIAANGANLAGTSDYDFSQEGVIGAASGIASTVKSSGADALMLTADTAGALPLLTQLLKENGVDPASVQYIGLTRWDVPPGTLALPGVQGGWFALPDPGLTAQFAQRYQQAYGAPPVPIASLAYDGIAAIGALVGQGNADALSQASLTQGSGYAGVNGVFRLLPDGTNERGLAVAQIRNNEVVVIDPAPRSFGGPGL